MNNHIRPITVKESQNHRRAWVGRDLQSSSSATPCNGQGHLSQDQVAQNPVQPGFEHFQGGDM